jgi:RNA polymerase sigma-70 factor, ECF subfamily
MEMASGAPCARPTAEQGRSDTGIVARAVRAAQQGDSEALAFLYARYADDICAYLRSIVGDHHEAEDLTQQLFAKLMRIIGKYQPREVPFLAWMLRVSRNLALDHLRSRRAVPCEEIRSEQRGEAVSTARAVVRSRELREALAALPSDQREVLLLRHLAGLSPGEIALRSGRSEGSIHGLHHRGRRALQADLLARGLAPAVAGAGARAAS